MKFNHFIILFCFFCLPVRIFSQNYYWVYFKDKAGVQFNLHEYFDQKAIDRRINHGIPLNDVTDKPVKEEYLAAVDHLSDTSLFASRWLNAVAVITSELQAEEIRKLPFVDRIEEMEPIVALTAQYNSYDTTMDTEEESVLKNQLLSMQGDLFEKAGIDGKGIRIAIFDVGFPGARENPAFENIVKEGRLIATKDFSKHKGKNVFWGQAHGTEVWSCIAGKVGDRKIGLATGAEFLLAKTEVNREPFSEELHWLAAAEWADKNGADIINSSLGYTNNRYFPWQMDGKTSFISRAANIAARKGMLVVNAAGNDGDGKWHVIGAPADADSVLSVGGINPETGYHTGFSSFGPTSDKRMKPNVCAYGQVVATSNSGFTSAQGTSFSSPLVAGFAACALQLRKGTGNMELFREIEKSGDLYPYFDYAHGFGVPQAGYFLDKKASLSIPTFVFSETDDSVKVIVKKEFISRESNEKGNSTNPPFDKNRYLYYNIMNTTGVLDSYYVIEVTQPEVLTIVRKEFTRGETLNVHFAG